MVKIEKPRGHGSPERKRHNLLPCCVNATMGLNGLNITLSKNSTGPIQYPYRENYSDTADTCLYKACIRPISVCLLGKSPCLLFVSQMSLPVQFQLFFLAFLPFCPTHQVTHPCLPESWSPLV